MKSRYWYALFVFWLLAPVLIAAWWIVRAEMLESTEAHIWIEAAKQAFVWLAVFAAWVGIARWLLRKGNKAGW